MNTQKQIDQYLATLPTQKSSEMQELYQSILAVMPNCKLWFLDGKDENGKIVTNPNIGFGFQTMHYVNGNTRDFYQIGISATTTGISVYILCLEDKKYLAKQYGTAIGKASVSGYCIKFKKLTDINIDVLKTIIQDAISGKMDKKIN